MRKIRKLIDSLMRIQRLEIDKRLRNKIRASWFKLFVLHWYDSRNKTADIVGFKIRYLNHRALSHLYHELFIGNAYHFSTEADDPYIIDCGSNIGMSVFYFKMLYPRSRLLAFEPGEEAYGCLEENIRNNFQDSVRVQKAALSNKEGTIDFFYDQSNPGSLRMSTRQERMPKKQSRTVEACMLSKYIDDEVDFLKLDIEGAEFDVIEELGKAGKLPYLRQMAIEYHHHLTRGSDDLSKMLRILEEAGFGYQIGAHMGRPFNRGQFQDILVYAYRKDPVEEPPIQDEHKMVEAP